MVSLDANSTIMIPWNKGKTKETHPSLRKTSDTLKSKKASNFLKWQRENKPTYKRIQKSRYLAELYGTLLGDGCLEALPRTDKMTISFNRSEQNHIKHVSKLIQNIIGKKPFLRIRRDTNCNDLYLYQKYLQKRLDFPYGEKLKHKITIPDWICKSKIYTKHCLKGLFETDGSWVIDNKYKTNVIEYSSRSTSLLDKIKTILEKHAFNPQRGKYYVRLARKAEVERLADWIQFRIYK